MRRADQQGADGILRWPARTGRAHLAASGCAAVRGTGLVVPGDDWIRARAAPVPGQGQRVGQSAGAGQRGACSRHRCGRAERGSSQGQCWASGRGCRGRRRGKQRARPWRRSLQVRRSGMGQGPANPRVQPTRLRLRLGVRLTRNVGRLCFAYVARTQITL